MKLLRYLSMNSPFFGLLTAVWAYLLGLIMLIGFLVVPIDKTQHTFFINLIIDGGKIFVSLLFIAIWLISWYKMLGYIFHFELAMSESNSLKE